jgi:sugar lactone lactonase YvrE
MLSPCSVSSDKRSLPSAHRRRRASDKRLAEIFVLWLAFGTLASVAQMVRIPAIRTLAGNGTQGYMGDGGAATSAELEQPFGVALDSAGNLYIAESVDNRIRKVTVATGIITTVAGNGTVGYMGDGGAATSAELNNPTGVTLDIAGNIYIADKANNCVRKVTAATGIITTVAGNGSAAYAGDGGLATSAELNSPTGVALDSTGNLYIADSNNNRVRKVTAATGNITSVAGNGMGDYTGDGGAATSAGLSLPIGVALDSTGNLYIADTFNNRIRKVTVATGIITTVAGNGVGNYMGDGGAATLAALNTPSGVAVDDAGNLYIADSNNNRVRKVTAAGIITTVGGNGGTGYTGDGGAATSAELRYPYGVALDNTGNILIADTFNSVIRKVDSPTGSSYLPNTNVGSSSIAVNVLLQPTTSLTLSSITAAVSQGGVKEYSVGTISGCTLSPTYTLSPADLCVVPITFSPGYPSERDVALTAVTSQGTVTFGLSGIGQGPLVALTPGIISTVAGNGTAGYVAGQDGGAANSAELNNPTGIAFDSAGNQYIADTNNNLIRKVTAATGVITTVAGNGKGSYSGDGGAAASAELTIPAGVSVDSPGNLYIADDGNSRIRKVAASSGIISTVAGNGIYGFSGDGSAATSAELTIPAGVSVDSAGNLYIADRNNNRIRKVTASSGIISTVAGNGTYGFSGDGGAATSAELEYPRGVAIDSVGNLYIADSYNERIRKVSASGIITTVAGNGTQGSSGDNGAATSAELFYPSSVSIDSAGNLYIADASNNRIRKVTVSTGIITTIAGSGTAGYVANQDSGVATSAELSNPLGMSFDSVGNLYITDSSNNRIRKVALNVSALSFIATSEGSVSSDSPKTVRLSNSGNMALSFPAPSASYNPAVSSANFVLDGGSSTTCPYEASSSAAGTLAAGSDCTFGFYFDPQQYGSLSATATVTDSSLNMSALQAISLSGSTTQTAPPGFTVTPATTSLTFASGATTGNSDVLTLTPTNGFVGTVALTCSISTSSAAFAPTCTVPPAVALSIGGSATATVTINSTTAQANLELPQNGAGTLGLRTGVLLASLLCFMPLRRRRATRLLAAFVLLATGLVTLSGCSSSTTATTRPLKSSAGAYTVTVTTNGTSTGNSSPATNTTTFTVTIN